MPGAFLKDILYHETDYRKVNGLDFLQIKRQSNDSGRATGHQLIVAIANLDHVCVYDFGIETK